MNSASLSPAAPRWPLPSPRVCELLRQGAEIALNAPQAWLDEIDQASVPTDDLKFVAEDPVLMAASRRATRSSLTHWAAANIERPGAPVPPHISPDMLSNARELVRRQATDLIFNAARSMQSAAWQLWMTIAFSLTSDPAELRELLDVSARSIAAFIDGTMEQINAFMKAEREAQMRGTLVDRRDLVTRILEGVAMDEREASQRLDYPLGHKHHAAVIWCEEAETELGQLETSARILADWAGSSPLLMVIANAATLWVWASADGRELTLSRLNQALQALPGVRMTLGSGDRGIDGFRRAHLEALSTQRMLGRLRADAQVVSFDQVRLVSLMSHDAEACRQFVSHTLGALSTAPESLQITLLTYLQTGCNLTETAQRLHTHRNTLLRRLARAEELLPAPLASNRVHIAAALEALNWSGHRGR
ncbi:PucR family transcriptional regulator [Aquabacterium sp.]|uniref:PucR family transcriptional regulator n=1 Tax=Aquabacterium sp. TaxID=1872578 RepID=UPI002E2F315E|nr:helix-turn-helix domain-containing protein [Aquabacterium sp.]HEX5311001.1 helix-turn-helix domain-containing protein [Aquabacterium sp.]